MQRKCLEWAVSAKQIHSLLYGGKKKAAFYQSAHLQKLPTPVSAPLSPPGDGEQGFSQPAGPYKGRENE
ncbi:hypothetical protein V6N12_060316 [Hibiscus sabdariffa]|uniref:Uncharacterized protein n=1 Tax=Hibiscus sabdariffa TaxID=183260 RepID=A0ABR2D6U5_9ROSI